MLSGATYLQINFGNLTLVKSINIEVPASFAPISTIQLGYSLDGSSFAMDPVKYLLNGSSTYSISLSKSILIRYLRVYLIDVVQPSDLLTKTSGFILNITGQTNSSDISVSSRRSFFEGFSFFFMRSIMIFRYLSSCNKSIVSTNHISRTSDTSWINILR